MDESSPYSFFCGIGYNEGMSKLKVFYFTKEKIKELQAEREQLKVDREAAVTDLSKARAMGDLSENGYYKAARQKLSSIDRRIRQVDIFLLNCQVIQSGGMKKSVDLGSRVMVRVNGQERELWILDEYEANPMEGKISYKSPIGKALVRKKVGDVVQVQVPAGVVEYEVMKIS